MYNIEDFSCAPQEDKAELILPDGKTVTIENVVHFWHIRVKIREQKLDGCQIKFKDRLIKISPLGYLLGKVPKGLFDQISILASKLF